MKKIAICIVLGIMSCINIHAQINGDFNWDATPVFFDDFNIPGRMWNADFVDYPLGRWHSYYFSTGVTHGDGSEHQVFQPSQCMFDSGNGLMKLVADFVSSDTMTCDDFEIPENAWFDCDYLNVDDKDLHYYSGTIETNRAFRYGYFEIRCKLPIHLGAFPAFWLFCKPDSNDPHYEEIDVFEFSWAIYYFLDDPNLQNVPGTRLFKTGSLFANDNSLGVGCGYKIHEVPSYTSLNSWNTFGCEWSPHRIVYYLNGDVINEYYDTDSVPHRPMTLIADYALDNYVQTPNSGQEGALITDTMYIDYIKVSQLKCDCYDNVVIRNNQDVVNYDYGLKKSIIFMPQSDITLQSGNKIVFRATDNITINGGFEIQQGREVELITHPCPDYNVIENANTNKKTQ